MRVIRAIGPLAIAALSITGCAPILINPLCATPNTNTFQQGKGTATDPYLICTIAQWQNMGSNLTKHFKLGKDLDFNGVTYTQIGAGSAFTGSFDGGNYTVSNVTLAGAGSVGLFGDVSSGGTISNLRILNPNISGTLFVGALSPYVTTNGSVSGITVTGATITGTGDYVGGVVGAVDSSGVLRNSSAAGTITGGQFVGGVAGVLSKIGTTCGTISGSSSSGSVTGVNSVGGVVGGTDSYCTLTTSSSSANVSGANWVGGVVGYSFATTMSDIGSTGTVTGDVYAGGVVGYINGATISNCFHTTGDVTVTATLAGGLIAGFESGSMTNCYFNSAAVTSPAGANVGGLIGGALAGSITYCYTSPTSVSAGGGGANAVISQDFSGGAVIDNTNVFYNTTTAGAGSDGTALTDAEMMDPDNYTAAGWSTSTWNLSFSSGSAMPTLR